MVNIGRALKVKLKEHYSCSHGQAGLSRKPGNKLSSKPNALPQLEAPRALVKVEDSEKEMWDADTIWDEGKRNMPKGIQTF